LLTPHIAAGSLAAANIARKNDYVNILSHIYNKPLQFRVV
jgi:hypothetical protein